MNQTKVITLTAAIVLAAAIAAWVVVVVVGYSAVRVTNGGTATLEVIVEAAGEFVGSAQLRPGDSMFRVFSPFADGAVAFKCRDHSSGRGAKHEFGYVTGGLATSYSIHAQSCAAVTEYCETDLFFGFRQRCFSPTLRGKAL